ncbi:hypothetical protein [Trinickia symbiotica]|uniref:hypothetical protein n=1 Tax=Trinickia symbiotica TaxID=863227 RepID=UPI002158C5BC|nr:hypothetical protein [Trinickia symbiotica]
MRDTVLRDTVAAMSPDCEPIEDRTRAAPKNDMGTARGRAEKVVLLFVAHGEEGVVTGGELPRSMSYLYPTTREKSLRRLL